MRGTSLDNTNLSYVNLKLALYTDGTSFPAEFSPDDSKMIRIGPESDLRGVDLSSTSLNDMDLRGADLSGANLRDANLSGVDLRGADLSDVDLRGANLRVADLRESNLSGTNLSGADLRRSSLSDPNLTDAFWDDDTSFPGEKSGLGRFYFEQGEYESALSEFQKVLKFYPEDSRALYNLGLTYFELGRYELAITEFRKTIEVDPQNGDATKSLHEAETRHKSESLN